MRHRLSPPRRLFPTGAALALLTLAGCAPEGDGHELMGEIDAAAESELVGAYSATALASSQESAAFPARAAVDGQSGTRWSSAFADPQTLTLDLGSVKPVARVVLRWEAAYSAKRELPQVGRLSACRRR